MNVFALSAILLTTLTLKTESVIAAIRNPLVLLSIALFSWMALSFSWTVAEPTDAIEGLRKYGKFLYVAFIYIALTRSNIHPTNLLYAFALTSSTLGCVSLAISFGDASWGRHLGNLLQLEIGPPSDPTIGRSYIAQGLYLVLSGPILMHYLWRNQLRVLYRNALSCAIIVVCLYVPIWLLNGWTAHLVLICGLIGLFVQLVMAKATGPLIKLTLLTAVFSALIMINTPQVFHKSNLQSSVAQHLEQRELTSVGIRLSLWEAGVIGWSNAPFFGHGVGSYSAVYERYTKHPELNWKQSHAHSEYVNLMVQGGVVGLTLWCLIGAYAIKKGVTTYRSGNRESGALIVFLTAAFGGGAFVNPFMWDAAQGVLGTLLVASIALFTEEKSK